MISKNSTANQKFACCNNTKCKSIFPFESREILGEAGLLCPACREKMHTHHMVQCENCQSVINFIYSDPLELPVIFYVKKCSLCTGTREDEKKIVPHYFPDAFI